MKCSIKKGEHRQLYQVCHLTIQNFVITIELGSTYHHWIVKTTLILINKLPPQKRIM